MANIKRQRGRPVERPLPPRIDAPPEEIARAFFRLPPDYEWEYVKRQPEVDDDENSLG